MKKSKKALRITAVTLGAVITCGGLAGFAGCGGKKDALVIMTEELNGLFNPFYSTAGTDMDVVGQTQISMLSTDNSGDIAYGDDEPVVVKDYMEETVNGDTQYTFVIKNGIKFSDGVPLTMNDILFNMYVYLDPAYTGSTTMYSTKIKGLSEYRLQQALSDGGSTLEDTLSTAANGRVYNRMTELINLYHTTGKQSGSSTSYHADPQAMRAAIDKHTPSAGYRNAIAPYGDQGNTEKGYTALTVAEARAQLLADYNRVVGDPNAEDEDAKKGLFMQELENDFGSALSQYAEAPYTNQKGKPETNLSGVTFNDVISFMAYEGFVTIEYKRDPQTNKEDKNMIEKVTLDYNADVVKDKASAVNYVYNAKISDSLDEILTSWATATTLRNEFTGKAKDVILHESVTKGELNYKKISGIVSVGHELADVAQVTVHGTNYNVSHSWNDDGTPSVPNTYDVLRITIDGTDPKAIWNFGFTVAPYHYYSDPKSESDTAKKEKWDLSVDIKNNKFGVVWSDFDFHTEIVQGNTPDGVSKNKVPMGAGPYVATDRSNRDNPRANAFLSDNIVYYKANENFFDGVQDKSDSLHAPYIKKMQYQVVSSSNALPALKQGNVDFVEPQLTQANLTTVQGMKNTDYKTTWQLGYGYIGINAGKVKNVNIRRAIMAAMQTSQATDYYSAGTVSTIYWPMSLVSWAYPRTAGSSFDPNHPLEGKDDDNKHDYAKFVNDNVAKETIAKYMELAHVGAGDPSLTITFTIAGSNLSEHPCYNVFKHAKDLLDSMGWNITLTADTNALIKLATGSLTVWAAAWGSTIDPDMYQVYHKNSTASSVLAWGYREILADTTTYAYENGILNSLSDLIDDARETTDHTTRANLYKNAMSYVLDLAIELPVYQRQVLYAYNTKVLDTSSLPTNINSYTSPLSKIWEVKFAG